MAAFDRRIDGKFGGVFGGVFGGGVGGIAPSLAAAGRLGCAEQLPLFDDTSIRQEAIAILAGCFVSYFDAASLFGAIDRGGIGHGALLRREFRFFAAGEGEKAKRRDPEFQHVQRCPSLSNPCQTHDRGAGFVGGPSPEKDKKRRHVYG